MTFCQCTCSNFLGSALPFWRGTQILQAKKKKERKKKENEGSKLNPSWADQFQLCLQKICYDNPGNVPKKGINFNTQTFRKMYLFVICMISRHWFQAKLLLYIA